MRSKGARPTLSGREEGILLLAADGLTDKEIARELDIAEGSVRTYWERMRDKTGCTNRAELIARSFRQKYEQSTDELRRMEELFRLLFQLSPVGMAVFNQEGVLEQSNAAFKALLGVREDHHEGLTFDELYAGRRFSPLWSHPPDAPTEVRARRSSGQGPTLIRRMIPIHIQGERKLLATAEDISELRHEYGSVSTSEKVMHELANQATSPALLVGPQGLVLLASAHAVALFGHGSTELLGRPFWTLFSDIDQDLIKDSWKRAREDSTHRMFCTASIDVGENDTRCVSVQLENKLTDLAIRAVIVFIEDVPDDACAIAG